MGDPEVTRLIDSRNPLSEDQVRDRLSKEISNEREHQIKKRNNPDSGPFGTLVNFTNPAAALSRNRSIAEL